MSTTARRSSPRTRYSCSIRYPAASALTPSVRAPGRPMTVLCGHRCGSRSSPLTAGPRAVIAPIPAPAGQGGKDSPAVLSDRIATQSSTCSGCRCSSRTRAPVARRSVRCTKPGPARGPTPADCAECGSRTHLRGEPTHCRGTQANRRRRSPGPSPRQPVPATFGHLAPSTHAQQGSGPRTTRTPGTGASTPSRTRAGVLTENRTGPKSRRPRRPVPRTSCREVAVSATTTGPSDRPPWPA